MVIQIDSVGNTTGIKSDLTEKLKLPNRQRVSHVEPVNRLARWLFHQIRSRVDDESKAAAFTRLWPCRWRARIFEGPTLGPFWSRRAAIAAEVMWINYSLLHSEDKP